MRQTWVRGALLAGAAYLVIGLVFALPTLNVRVWRWVAWVISAAVFATHIGYEHFRLRHSSRSTATHTAVGVAIGALGLAINGALHSLAVAHALRPSWLLALVLWPAFLAVPAFLVAIVAATMLTRFASATPIRSNLSGSDS